MNHMGNSGHYELQQEIRETEGVWLVRERE